MPPKTPESSSGKPVTQPAAAKSVKERKAWVKKTPVEIVLDQAEKLRAEIAKDEEELKAKKRQLAKFEEVRRIFEGG